MTDTTETTTPTKTTPKAPAGRRLPGADRARAFTEPPASAARRAGQLELPDVLTEPDHDPDPDPADVSWERFTREPSAGSTDVLTEGGWVPPAPPEPPALPAPVPVPRDRRRP